MKKNYLEYLEYAIKNILGFTVYSDFLIYDIHAFFENRVNNISVCPMCMNKIHEKKLKQESNGLHGPLDTYYLYYCLFCSWWAVWDTGFFPELSGGWDCLTIGIIKKNIINENIYDNLIENSININKIEGIIFENVMNPKIIIDSMEYNIFNYNSLDNLIDNDYVKSPWDKIPELKKPEILTHGLLKRIEKVIKKD